MKRSFILLCPLLIGICSCTAPVNVDKEKEAIKAVIQEEKDGYFARDTARLAETWVQDSSARKIYFSADGMVYLDGWNKVNEDHKANLESEMWDNAGDLKAEFSDFEFNIYGKTALVFCNTTWTGMLYGKELNAVQKRILHFVKVNGKWKYDLMAIYRIPEGNAAENKKTAAIYHELDPENIDMILTEDFIGRNEKSRHTWNRENHRNYLTNGVFKRDSIFRQVAEGNWVATRFFREGLFNGDTVKFEAMQFKRFEDGKIAEIWEYGDTQQVE
jgi:hypothetical protein